MSPLRIPVGAVSARALLVAVATACSAGPAPTTPAASSPPVVASTSVPSSSTGSSPTPSSTLPLPTTTATPLVTATPQPTKQPATATTTPAPTPEPQALAEPIWERVDDQESLADSKMFAVAAGTNSYVAVGVTADDVGSGIAWTSSDGRTWVRSSAHFTDQYPTLHVIWDGRQFVIFGAPYPRPVAWVSPDGQSWTAANVIPTTGSVDKFWVASNDGILYSIGGFFGDDDPTGSNVFKTWTSTDGLSWQPVETVTPPPALSYLRGLTAANGTLLAWGETWDDIVSRSMVVSSPDGGRTWQSAFVGKSDNYVNDVIGLPSGVLAVGTGRYCCDEGGSRPVRAWISADALTWSGATFLPEAGSDSLDHVATYAGGYVALGIRWDSPISWRSNDGSVWVESSSVPDAHIDQMSDCTPGGPCPDTVVTDLVDGGTGLVAVGQNQREVSRGDEYILEFRSVVWVAPPPSY